MKWVCFPKFYRPFANWPWLRISPQSSLYVIYCLILAAWHWLMSFACIPVQSEPNKSPLRKRLLVLLLWEIGHLSSPNRSCLGRHSHPWWPGGLFRQSSPTPKHFIYSEHWLWSQINWVQILLPKFISCVTLRKFVNLSRSQFFNYKIGIILVSISQ